MGTPLIGVVYGSTFRFNGTLYKLLYGQHSDGNTLPCLRDDFMLVTLPENAVVEVVQEKSEIQAVRTINGGLLRKGEIL